VREIVICEDSEIDRGFMKAVLEQYFRERNEAVNILEYSSGKEVIADLEEEYLHMDLLILDIYMKDSNGMETAKKLRELHSEVPIVFYTASSEFAVESYDVQASGYLMKPLEKEKLGQLLDRLFEEKPKKRLAVKVRREYRYIDTDDILYLESDKHSVTVHLMDGTEIQTTEKLSEIAGRINESRFLHCNQSYLVNMDQIKDVKNSFLLVDGTEVPIRIRGRREIIKRYNQYFMEHFTKM